MTVGATDTFSQTRDEIIADALANLGAIGPGESAAGPMRDHAARALNRIVKAIDADGSFLWRFSRLTFATVSGTATYTLDATALDVDDPVSYRAAGGTSRIPLSPMSSDDFRVLPDRTTTGQPSRYLVEKTLTGAGVTLMTMTLYPVPNATSDSVEYTVSIRAKDYIVGSDTSDFPTNWIKCLVYGLSAELAPSYGQTPLVKTFMQMFLAEKDAQLGSDNEKQSLIFVPFGGRSCYGGNG